jgi:hypothetical protein
MPEGRELALPFPATCPVTVYVKNVTSGTNNNQPTKPALISPANGGASSSDKVALSWSASTDADNNLLAYYYEIDDKRLFTNMNGGLKADGNPLGATGGAQIFEVFKQLRGEAGERQVKTDTTPRFGCSLEMEGFGTKAYASILGRE